MKIFNEIGEVKCFQLSIIGFSCDRVKGCFLGAGDQLQA